MKIDEGGLLGPKSTSFSDSGTNWDGVIGFRGEFRITECLFVPCLIDIGTGDSEVTWQAFGGLGYRFGWGKLFAGYRYMDYDLQDGAPLKNLDIGGPIIGAVFTF